jgi:squalene synthase HpnC
MVSTIHSWSTTQVPSLNEARAYCRALARSHYENFTVVSWFLPKRFRQDLYHVYGFCRTVDDLGDEAAGDRLTLLDRWETELRSCYGEGGHAPTHPVMVALQETIGKYSIPPEPFLKLIEANRMDQRQRRYLTYADLAHYCQHSADPVGHLVLYIWGYRDAERQRLSDATCTALQLTNFWQDVRRDWAMGRLYIPQEDMARFRCTEAELAAGDANNRFRALMAFEVERARGLFQEGLRLLPLVERELRVDLRLFTAGGLEVLDAIEAQGYDVLSRRPALSRWRKARLTLSALAALRLGLGSARA